MTTKTPREHDLLDELAEIAPVVAGILEQTQRRQASYWLSISQSDVAMWETRGNAQRRLCSETAKCADIRCRRKQYCRKLKWIAAKDKAARARLTAAQATLQACQHETSETPEPPSCARKKGRTGVRP